MKKLIQWKPSLPQIACILFLGLIAILIPLLALSVYSVPWYDDYEYTKYTQSFMNAYGHNLWNAIRGALFQTHESYYAWQGTFSSVFFMAFSPIVWGTKWYFLGAVFLILILTCSCILFFYAICKVLFKLESYVSLCIGTLATILILLKPYSIPEAFYWYNAGIHYIGMHSFMLLLISVSILLIGKSNIGSKLSLVILTCLLALIVSGANFVTALQGFLFFGLVILWAWYYFKKRTFLFLPALLIYVYGLFKNVSAPGNTVRSAHFTEVAYSPVKAVLMSFVKAFQYLGTFTDLFTIVLLIMMLPILWYGAKQISCKFAWPGIILICSFCLYATGFTPSLYAMGYEGVPRTINVVKLTYQILLILNELYLVGYVHRLLESKKGTVPEGKAPWWYYGACLVAWALLWFVSSNRIMDFSSYGAFYYIYCGEAAQFHEEYNARIALLESDETDIIVTPYSVKPYFLCVGDLTTDPEYEANRFMANFYGKNSLKIQE